MEVLPPGAHLGESALSSLGKRRRRHVLVAATSSWFLVSIATMGLIPLYPDIAADLGLRPDVMGAIVGLGALAGALLQIPIGVAADSFRLRNLLIIGVIASGIAPLMWGLSSGPQLFAIGQVLVGIGGVCLQAGGITAVAKAYAGAGRAEAVSYIWSAQNLGWIASILIFGLVAGQVGWRTVAVSAAWIPLLAIPLVLTMPEVALAEQREGAQPTSRFALFLLDAESSGLRASAL